MTVHARPLDALADHPQLLQLFELVFGGTVTPAIWAWKYLPPWTARHYCSVAEVDGRVIGYCGAVPLRGQVAGRPVPFFQLADIMVHPDHRRSHDWFELGPGRILDDIGTAHPQHVLYGFSGHRAFLWFKRTGLVDLIERASTGIVRHRVRDTAGHAVRPWSWDDPGIDATWRQFGPATGLIRDGTYLRWRYRDHPLHGYRLYGVQRDGAPVGWLVIGTDPPGENGRRAETPVVDLLLPSESLRPGLEALARELRRDVMVWQPQRSAPAWDATVDPDTHVFHFARRSMVTTASLQEQLYYTMGDVDWW